MLLIMKEIVVIIGGGIAGLEAASQLLKLGYSPIIIEKEDHLGGKVANWHKLFPDILIKKLFFLIKRKSLKSKLLLIVA